MSPASPQPQHILPENLALIITGLCQALGALCATNYAIAPPMILLLWGRLHRTASRFRVLFARWQNGRLPTSRAQTSRPSAKPAPAANKPKFSLPRGNAWLVKFAPQTAIYGSQLQHFLADPEIAAFLAEAPQAGRLLRPLCRMLGVKPLPQMLRPAAPSKKSPRKPSAARIAAKKLRLFYAEHISPRLPRILPEDLRSFRPVSHWCRPARSRG